MAKITVEIEKHDIDFGEYSLWERIDLMWRVLRGKTIRFFQEKRAE